MLRPEKHMSLRFCILNVSSEILKQFKSIASLPIVELEASIIEKLGRESEAVFVRALTFLHALGLLEYDIDSDMVYLVESSGDQQ